MVVHEGSGYMNYISESEGQYLGDTWESYRKAVAFDQGVWGHAPRRKIKCNTLLVLLKISRHCCHWHRYISLKGFQSIRSSHLTWAIDETLLSSFFYVPCFWSVGDQGVPWMSWGIIQQWFPVAFCQGRFLDMPKSGCSYNCICPCATRYHILVRCNVPRCGQREGFQVQEYETSKRPHRVSNLGPSGHRANALRTEPLRPPETLHLA